LHKFYKPPVLKDPHEKKQRKCSYCHSTEHTARTCEGAIRAKKQEEIDLKNFCGLCDSSHPGECGGFSSYLANKEKKELEKLEKQKSEKQKLVDGMKERVRDFREYEWEKIKDKDPEEWGNSYSEFLAFNDDFWENHASEEMLTRMSWLSKINLDVIDSEEPVGVQTIHGIFVRRTGTTRTITFSSNF
jgi:hypothetical protein